MPQLNVPTTTCTAATRSGRFCDRESLPGAPFPICLKHATQLLGFINDCVDERGSAAQVAQQIVTEEWPEVQPSTRLKATWRGTEVVYYLRVGEHIKVGYTSNLAQRLRAYPPDADLLAYEPGSRTLERERLKQFGRYKSVALEWFKPGPLLLQHIKSLQASQALAS